MKLDFDVLIEYLLVAIASLVLGLALLWSVSTQPLLNDSATYLLSSTLELNTNAFSVSSLLIDPIQQFPIQQYLLFGWLKLFPGENISGVHWFGLAWWVVLLTSIYSLFRSKFDSITSSLVWLSLAVVPHLLMLTQTMSPWLVGLTLVVVGITAWHKQQYLIAALFWSAAAVSAWFTWVYIIACLAYQFWKNKGLPRTYLLIGLSVLSWWMFVFVQTGQLVLLETLNTPQLLNQLVERLSYLGFIVRNLSITPPYSIVAIAIAGSLGYLAAVKSKPDKSVIKALWLSLASFVGIAFYHLITGNFQVSRHFPLLILLLFLSLQLLKQIEVSLYKKGNNYLVWGLIFLVMVLSIFEWRRGSDVINDLVQAETNLNYQDQLLVNRQAGVYLESVGARETIYTGYPQNYYLSLPELGYVTRALEVLPCDQYQGGGGIIVTQPHHPSQISCAQLGQSTQADSMRRLSQNQTWIEILRIPESSPSAEAEADSNN